jgi:hypothetical protein
LTIVLDIELGLGLVKTAACPSVLLRGATCQCEQGKAPNYIHFAFHPNKTDKIVPILIL